ncbi:MAG: VOC family protein [Pseudomonadota bacterium]
MAVPEGYTTVAAYLTTPEADAVLAFARQVFGAKPLRGPFRGPDGRMVHASLQIGDSVVMMGQARDGSVTTAMLHVYVADCDATYADALAAGAVSFMPPADQPYGDRAAGVHDVAGNAWWIAQRLEALDDAAMAERIGAQLDPT